MDEAVKGHPEVGGEGERKAGAQPRKEPRSPAHLKPLTRPETFPDRYGETYFVLIEVSPHTIFSFWEIANVDLDRAQYKIQGRADLVIRVYDVTFIVFNGGNAHGYFDIEAEGQAHNWYVHGLGPGRSYIADIGFRDQTGKFVVMARSNCVQTPREHRTDEGPNQWMQVEKDPRKRQFVPGEQFTPILHVLPPTLPAGIDGVHPSNLMGEVSREDVVAFYQDLWQACTARGGNGGK